MGGHSGNVGRSNDQKDDALAGEVTGSRPRKQPQIEIGLLSPADPLYEREGKALFCTVTALRIPSRSVILGEKPRRLLALSRFATYRVISPTSGQAAITRGSLPTAVPT